VQPKPVSQNVRPKLTRLPPLTPARRIARRLFHWTARLAIALLTHARVSGLEHFPRQGPALVVTNHLGDADAVVALAFFPLRIDTLGKAELHDFPVLGKIMDLYGTVWVHRGQPDRRALRAALDGLRAGRIVAIAPEGRESLTGALEEATGGAAYLALKAGVPILPVTFTGTENRRVYANLKRLRRTDVTMMVGPAFTLAGGPSRQAIELGTQKIMRTLAAQLPPEYRGAYQ
jgi:1-acyl-sn-glycerol-3-phosphate acyltransferase